LEVKFYIQNKNWPLTIWLQDFNWNFADAKDDINIKETPQSPSYKFGDDKKPDYSTINNLLMSYWKDVDSFSQVYLDEKGKTPLDTIKYDLPEFGGVGLTNIFTVTEKPENHQLRMIEENISRQVILTDILRIVNYNDTRMVYYKNQLLVRDSFTIDLLNDIININWVIKTKKYSN
jgi:hypothetical protein